MTSGSGDVAATAVPPELAEDPRLAGRRWTVKRRIDGRHSQLLELVDAEGSRIFVKRSLRTSGEADPRLTREFRGLSVLRGRLESGWRDSVPAPLGTFSRATILVVGGVEGTALSRVLKRDANVLTGRLRGDRLRVLGGMTGDWLRRFHEATTRSATSHDHDRFRRDLDAALERLRRRTGGEGLDDVRRMLSEESARLHGRRLPIAARHGDFLPQNVLVTAQRVSVVDFENYRVRDTVHRDIGHMLAYVMMLGRQRGYLPWALRQFTRGFVAARGGAALAVEQRLFTAEGAVRIARDSGSARASAAMRATVATLLNQAVHGQEAITA